VAVETVVLAREDGNDEAVLGQGRHAAKSEEDDGIEAVEYRDRQDPEGQRPPGSIQRGTRARSSSIQLRTTTFSGESFVVDPEGQVMARVADSTARRLFWRAWLS
jgi:hypothetical protein